MVLQSNHDNHISTFYLQMIKNLLTKNLMYITLQLSLIYNREAPMFCSSCGKEIVDDAIVCIGCGRSISKTPKQKEKWTTPEMVVMVITTMIIPLIGFIYGGIGLSKKEKQGQGALLLVTAIIVSALQALAFFYS